MPELTSVNGTGTADTVPGHASQHIANSLLLTGTHFSGSRVKLHGGAYDGLSLALVDGNSNDSQMEVTLPQDLVAGSYTLRVSNQAGADSTSVTVLQGEQGIPGVYVAGAGIDVNGDTLSVTYGGTGGAFGTSNNVARADHGHPQDLADLNTSLTAAMTAGDTATLNSALTSLRGASTGLGSLTRPCTDTNGRPGQQTFGSEAWSASCNTSAMTWNCTTAPNLVGCSQSNPASSCAAIMTAGYTGGDGTFWISGSPAFQAYCDMTTPFQPPGSSAPVTGGWMLIFNLDTSDNYVQHYYSTFWTTDTPLYGNANDPFAMDFKSPLFSSVALSGKSIMLVAHGNGGAYDRGFYVANGGLGTFKDVFLSGSADLALTGGRLTAAGADPGMPSPVIPARRALSTPSGSMSNAFSAANAGRIWNGGDTLLDTNKAIMTNSSVKAKGSSSNGTATHNVRVGIDWTSLTSDWTAQTGVACTNFGLACHPTAPSLSVGGWGGFFTQTAVDVSGSYYEGAAMSSYCQYSGYNANGGLYGNNSQNNGSQGNLLVDACTYTVRNATNYDLAVYVR